MRRSYPLTALAAALALTSCLLPGRRDPTEPANAGFLQDYGLLHTAKLVRRAYLKPETDLHRYHTVRIPDLENYTGHAVDPEALRLAADAVADALQALPPSHRPFALVDRSPRDAGAWVDLRLEAAMTTYDLNADAGGLSRLSHQTVLAVECRLVDGKSGEVVGLIQHRVKVKLDDVEYQNPVRSALAQLGHDIAGWLADPQVEIDDEDRR
jgi:hypothetical protein